MGRILLFIVLLIILPVAQVLGYTENTSIELSNAAPVEQSDAGLQVQGWNLNNSTYTARVLNVNRISNVNRTSLQVDKKYLSPSMYVNYLTAPITTLVDGMALDGVPDYEKVTRLHNWITNHIAYDYDAHATRSIGYVKASQVLVNGKGLCSGYSFLFAAMCRYAGVPCQVIHGMAREDLESPWGYHSWNAVLINNQWYAVDATWDAGYINGNGQFVFQSSSEFFLPDPIIFSQTHTGPKITTY